MAPPTEHEVGMTCGVHNKSVVNSGLFRVANITSSQAPAKQLCSLPSWHDDP